MYTVQLFNCAAYGTVRFTVRLPYRVYGARDVFTVQCTVRLSAKFVSTVQNTDWSVQVVYTLVSVWLAIMYTTQCTVGLTVHCTVSPLLSVQLD